VKYFKPHSNSYLFLTRTNNKLKDTQVRTIIHRKAERAEINKRLTPHTFRRSFATLLNGKGAKLTTIQKLLGHSHITTTTQYIHQDYESIYQDYSKL
jgi:integrase/recombinase XerD